VFLVLLTIELDNNVFPGFTSAGYLPIFYSYKFSEINKYVRRYIGKLEVSSAATGEICIYKLFYVLMQMTHPHHRYRSCFLNYEINYVSPFSTHMVLKLVRIVFSFFRLFHYFVPLLFTYLFIYLRVIYRKGQNLCTYLLILLTVHFPITHFRI